VPEELLDVLLVTVDSGTADGALEADGADEVADGARGTCSGSRNPAFFRRLLSTAAPVAEQVEELVGDLDADDRERSGGPTRWRTVASVQGVGPHIRRDPRSMGGDRHPATLKMPGSRSRVHELDGTYDVVFLDELQERIEAEDRRDERQLQRPE